MEKTQEDASTQGDALVSGNSAASASGSALAEISDIPACSGKAKKCCSVVEDTCGKIRRGVPRFSLESRNPMQWNDTWRNHSCYC